MQAVSKIISRVSGFLLLALIVLSAPSCGVYSFTGASIPAEAKTISIQYFQNNALLVEPLLSGEFTNALRDRFMSQTSLNMVNQNGDLAFEGEITDYRTTPVAIQSDQTAALNRLEIKVNVRFTNKYDESTNFETQFTQYKEYPSEQDLNAIKTELITEIVAMLVDDIFNKSVVNW
ncbi:MAG: LPS assembly lipoprotein LptE [Bacteroidales bacterium]|nr:LPS assembly lipoprotein LptE [Bacteroidales bacterium]